MAEKMIGKTEAMALLSDGAKRWTKAMRQRPRGSLAREQCRVAVETYRAARKAIAALGLLGLLAALLLVGCASGRSGTQVVQACSGLPALQAYCQTSLVKSRQLTRTCEQVPLAQLLCAVTAAPRAESAAASAMPSCPEPPAPACVGALLESQGWRSLTSSRREKLRSCADYLVSVQACRDGR